MHESRRPDATGTPRQRCTRDQRVSTTTCVFGVRMYGTSHGQKAEPRIGIPYTGEASITKYKTIVLRDGVDATAAVAKLKDGVIDLRGAAHNETADEVPPAATVAGLTQPSARGAVKTKPSASEVDNDPVASSSASWFNIFPNIASRS